jgi:hypothetical protein
MTKQRRHQKLTEFIHYFTQLQDSSGTVIMTHLFFGTKVYICEKFDIINDEQRIGLHVMGQDIYMLKKDVHLNEIQDKLYMLADEFLQLQIIVN